MSILYSNLKGGRCRRQIAKYFGVADTIMVSWLHTITYVRNICAHHSRLWNKTFGITPMMPRRTTFPFVTLPTKGTQHVYFVLCMIQYLLNIINPSNTFRNKINVLLEEYPNIDIVAMGFPENWKEQLLWKSWTIKRVIFPCLSCKEQGFVHIILTFVNDTAMMGPRNKKKQFETVRKLRTIFRLFRNLRNIWCSFSSNHRCHLGIEMHNVWLSI